MPSSGRQTWASRKLAPASLRLLSYTSGGIRNTRCRAVTAKSWTMGSSGTGTTAARRSAPPGAISYSASRLWPELTPKFHTVPSGSTLGWAEKGMPARSARQVFTPSVSSVRASMRVAEPPSHSASTSPCIGSTLVLATLMASAEVGGSTPGGMVPKASVRWRPAFTSATRLGVAT
ncbi:hypothetical protein D9M68_465200 [compost metagenome]